MQGVLVHYIFIIIPMISMRLKFIIAPKTGQGTTVTPSALISSVLGSTWYDNPIGATFKSCFLYEGWGNFNRDASSK